MYFAVALLINFSPAYLFSPAVTFFQVCWNSVTSTTTDKERTLRSFGTAAGDGATFVEIRAMFAKDIGPLSMVPTEKELVLSPNSLFKVVASFGSDQLQDLQGKP